MCHSKSAAIYRRYRGRRRDYVRDGRLASHITRVRFRFRLKLRYFQELYTAIRRYAQEARTFIGAGHTCAAEYPARPATACRLECRRLAAISSPYLGLP